jgi:hypothetical protein
LFDYLPKRRPSIWQSFRRLLTLKDRWLRQRKLSAIVKLSNVNVILIVNGEYWNA